MKLPRIGLVHEFKEFAVRGSVVDLAVGIIVGAAFTKIVNSLVSDILMPPIGLLVSNVNFSQLHVMLREARTDAAGKVLSAAVTLNYGSFLSALFGFVIVAFAVFLLVKGINTIRRRQEPAPAPKRPTEVELLAEIRDLLKEKR